jgi:membrane protein DedA with SNARE-associated domain
MQRERVGPRPSGPAVRAILIALLIPILPFVAVGELPGERWLSGADRSATLFGALGGGLLAVDVLLPVPSTIVGSLLGARLGFLSGWLWGWGGLVAGNQLGYWAGRMLLSSPGFRLPGPPTGPLVFATRPVPVLAEAVAIAAGAGRMPALSFLATSVLGNAVFAAAMAGNGAALLPERWAGPGLVLPMLLPVVAWVAWLVTARRLGSPASETEDS